MAGIDRASTGRAFTLIEVMIVVAILGIVLAMTVIALSSAGVETSMNTGESAMQNTANQFAERLVSELRNASRSSVKVKWGGAETTEGDRIEFQVPVDVDSNGAVDLDADGTPLFGATLGRAHTAGASIVYEFRRNRVGGQDEKLDEAALRVDLDGDQSDDDGYMAESFYRGVFTRTAPDADGGLLARAVSDRFFLVQEVEDGGAPPEPVFARDAGDGTITIRLLAADVMERQETPIRSLVTVTVRPFNP